MAAAIHVLYEDNHLLVVNKPAGLATTGVDESTPSLAKMAKQHLKHKHQKPGNVYLGVMSRLDRLVSGVVVLARTSKAAARLTDQFRDRAAEKVYWAIVAPAPRPPAGECVDWIVHDDRAERMVTASPDAHGARRAELSYRSLRPVRGGTLVEVRLQTGRKHQIRLQMAARGWPIVGDRKYGSGAKFPQGIALHARRLGIIHPTTGKELTFEAPPPSYWPPVEA